MPRQSMEYGWYAKPKGTAKMRAVRQCKCPQAQHSEASSTRRFILVDVIDIQILTIHILRGFKAQRGHTYKAHVVKPFGLQA